MKTFRQIADENHLDRTTIFKRAKKIKNFKAKHMTESNHEWFIDDKGVKLLISHKNIRPKKYKSRINTKYDYWKRAKYLEDENKILLTQLNRVTANNTKLTNNNQKLVSQSKQNEKRLTAKESKPQRKIEDPVKAEWDRREKKQEAEIKRLKAENNKNELKKIQKKLSQHPFIRKWLGL